MKTRVIFSLLLVLLMISSPASAGFSFVNFPGSPVGRVVTDLPGAGVEVTVDNTEPGLTDIITLTVTVDGGFYALYKEPFFEEHGYLDEEITNSFVAQNLEYTVLAGAADVLATLVATYPEHAANPSELSTATGTINLGNIRDLTTGTYRVAVILRRGEGGIWFDASYHYVSIDVQDLGDVVVPPVDPVAPVDPVIATVSCVQGEERCTGTALEVCQDGMFAEVDALYKECKDNELVECRDNALIIQECLLCTDNECFATLPDVDLGVPSTPPAGTQTMGVGMPAPQAAPQAAQCTDTDQGANYFNKGTVISTGSRLVDHCGVEAERGKLIEYVCDANNAPERIAYDCQHGCFNGECIEAVEVSDKARNTCIAQGGFINLRGECVLGQNPNVGRPCGCGADVLPDGRCSYECDNDYFCEDAATQRCCTNDIGVSCGDCGGVIQCNGECSIDTPPDLGNICNRNACGQGTGVVTCDLPCSAPEPALPSNLNDDCNAGGFIQCNSQCSRGIFERGVPTWTNYFSEEQPAMFCPGESFDGGMQCTGNYCDNLRLYCTEWTFVDRILNNRIKTLTTGCVWSGFFSEENPAQQCSGNRFIQGVQCSGPYCDNVNLYCCQSTAPADNSGKEVTLNRKNCEWTRTFSEEQGDVHCTPPQLAAGLECTGSYCDTKRILCCEPTMDAQEEFPTVPAYRTLRSNGDHFYTRSRAEAIGAGIFEGIAAYLYSSPVPNSAPLYRLSCANGEHLYTTSVAERDGSGCVQEGDLGYLSTIQRPGFVPLYRSWNPSIPDHYLSTDINGVEAKGYEVEPIGKPPVPIGYTPVPLVGPLVLVAAAAPPPPPPPPGPVDQCVPKSFSTRIDFDSRVGWFKATCAGMPEGRTNFRALPAPGGEPQCFKRYAIPQITIGIETWRLSVLDASSVQFPCQDRTPFPGNILTAGQVTGGSFECCM